MSSSQLLVLLVLLCLEIKVRQQLFLCLGVNMKCLVWEGFKLTGVTDAVARLGQKLGMFYRLIY